MRNVFYLCPPASQRHQHFSSSCSLCCCHSHTKPSFHPASLVSLKTAVTNQPASADWEPPVLVIPMQSTGWPTILSLFFMTCLWSSGSLPCIPFTDLCLCLVLTLCLAMEINLKLLDFTYIFQLDRAVITAGHPLPLLLWLFPSIIAFSNELTPLIMKLTVKLHV